MLVILCEFDLKEFIETKSAKLVDDKVTILNNGSRWSAYIQFSAIVPHVCLTNDRSTSNSISTECYTVSQRYRSVNQAILKTRRSYEKASSIVLYNAHRSRVRLVGGKLWSTAWTGSKDWKITTIATNTICINTENRRVLLLYLAISIFPRIVSSRWQQVSFAFMRMDICRRLRAERAHPPSLFLSLTIEYPSRDTSRNPTGGSVPAKIIRPGS